ncbi:hypothetical protein AUF42_03555 [Francisella hispaniensis FSC454]|uniref:Type I restriction modification DNA specificity domain-containing protein n=2 Tax=Francisella hispaniensis TaxID=622488 RepID=A0AAC9J833_9GAMM|nr:hypothetical protein FSC454_01675 [Francisella hispaniensis FSC454]KYW86396.1 hypothetical protein AUF42_03555 [Francisella hispaniensis FSC454]
MCSDGIRLAVDEKKFSKYFVYSYINSSFFRDLAEKSSTGSTRKRIGLDVLKKLSILTPSFKEQQKIADCLSSVDELIEAQSQKVELLKEHKKGLMQKLFPVEGKTTPEYRFPEFRDAGEWVERELGDCLNYIQPSKYIVKSTEYNDSYKTPVLTAGKSFILGYTNEIDGVFLKDLPVIIFDDFTTASKFVDFPFKVKSSAIKILLSKKDINVKFVYEAMQNIKYEVGVHERHWISIFSKLNIRIPNPKEQQKIADCLSSVDELIEAQSQKVELLKEHKKGLMQRLFPVTTST